MNQTRVLLNLFFFLTTHKKWDELDKPVELSLLSIYRVNLYLRKRSGKDNTHWRLGPMDRNAKRLTGVFSRGGKFTEVTALFATWSCDGRTESRKTLGAAGRRGMEVVILTSPHARLCKQSYSLITAN